MTSLFEQDIVEQIFVLNDAHDLRARIVALMRFRGLSMRQLARSSGVSMTSVHSLVSGKTQDPQLSTIRKIAAALGTRASVLIGEDD